MVLRSSLIFNLEASKTFKMFDSKVKPLNGQYTHPTALLFHSISFSNIYMLL